MANTRTLFSFNTSSYQTLISPANLNYFYLNFKLGDLSSIQQRFNITQGAILTDHQINGIYKYLEYIIQRQVNKGQVDSAMTDDYRSYSRFGQLFSAALKKGYTIIFEQMDQWFPTRILAASMDVNSTDCSDYINYAVSDNQTLADQICA